MVTGPGASGSFGMRDGANCEAYAEMVPRERWRKIKRRCFSKGITSSRHGLAKFDDRWKSQLQLMISALLNNISAPAAANFCVFGSIERGGQRKEVKPMLALS